ncbi:hypothetical protein CYMTET_35669 [Cymbomonas tetramitiformis]|uniref:Uncharacterized protein n=1 Tax=Cymbomonas tetramitiformis TaxID=36881 RepID=A0AAE0KNM8_9CHLO|nr:hypothetical protein CYMTET_35669 [Cymbomonas tetramitiformis]|eukprot:gene305-564_t
MWCEWASDDKTTFAVRALWTLPAKIVICVRVRGTRDSHPWKQLTKKAEGFCEAGIDNYVGTENLQGLFYFPSPKSALAFTDRCVFTSAVTGGLDLVSSTEDCLQRIPVSVEIHCLQSNACVLHTPGCLRGVFARRTYRMLHNEKRSIVSMYCVEEDAEAASDTANIEVLFGHLNSDGSRAHALPFSMVGDSHLLACKTMTYDVLPLAKKRVELKDRAGRPVEDLVVCDALSLYNKAQDVDFGEEMLIIAGNRGISRRRLFEALRDLYDVAVYNHLEWMRIASSVYLLQNYRSSDYVVDLYDVFRLHTLDVTTDMLYETRAVMASMERMVHSGGSEIEAIVDRIFNIDVSEVKEWQPDLIKRILSTKCVSKRKREDAA